MPDCFLEDSFGRHIDYLRISVTDRCNFRCVYCMPPGGIPFLPRSNILTFEEITRVARIFLQMGGKKLRITGGEPLLRKNIVALVENLSRLEGLKSLGLTTNGFYLKTWAASLKKAGLKQVNISLDSLSPSRFSSLTDCSQFEKVWEGIEEALSIGLQTKINVVALKGLSEKEILTFGRMALNLPVEIRFIEFMPLCGTGWHPEWVLKIKEVRDILKKNFELSPLLRGTEVAETFQMKEGKGRICFIASMTEPFCENCSRLRLTSDGKLRPCLFSNEEINLKPWLQEESSDAFIIAKIKEAVRKKPEGHSCGGGIQNPLELPKIRLSGG